MKKSEYESDGNVRKRGRPGWDHVQVDIYDSSVVGRPPRAVQRTLGQHECRSSGARGPWQKKTELAVDAFVEIPNNHCGYIYTYAPGL